MNIYKLLLFNVDMPSNIIFSTKRKNWRIHHWLHDLFSIYLYVYLHGVLFWITHSILWFHSVPLTHTIYCILDGGFLLVFSDMCAHVCIVCSAKQNTSKCNIMNVLQVEVRLILFRYATHYILYCLQCAMLLLLIDRLETSCTFIDVVAVVVAAVPVLIARVLPHIAL